MANKIGRNKKWCENYKKSGKREENKRVKQERDQKRRERFEKRKEEGKTYKYDPAKSAAKMQEAFKDYNTNSKEFKDMKEILVRDLFAPNQGSNQPQHTHYAQWTSVDRKITKEMEQRKNELKKAAEKGSTKKSA